jgi:16S rRNA (cytosine967-C5)-methyltransferase
VLADLEARCDLVLIDAPCTGTGAWRRHPDAKWRLAPGALDRRLKAQRELLAMAVRFVKPGGRLAYVTCSALREENEDQIAAFLAANPDFAAVQPPKLRKARASPTSPASPRRMAPASACRRRRAGRTGFTFVSWRSAE